ncbi:hypothetical protein EJ04DRAFT_586010 [Polyplosphaeria fusca]|uniref:Uncharacterized protein n=1 Tax=Polyplosphaeria fusca TaxID=682080 RepID=A0A9P4R858_9PLEO|nr:hypothetical protein EJ04DRAFT_586010 [Polyplosphaeria fusca]
MPITEFVFPILKPETAQEALSAVYRESKPFLNFTGIQYRRVGHILRHNADDISSQYRFILNLEWDKPESFYHYYPDAPEFGAFMGAVIKYMAGKATPRLFEPKAQYGSSVAVVDRGVTQLLIAEKVGEKKGEVDGAWEKLVEALKKEGSGSETWSGWGLDNAEGTWTGLLGWKDQEEMDGVVGKGGVAEALRKVKEVVGVEEYVVKFQA